MTPPTLTTERLTLRAHDPADWPAFRDFYMSDAACPVGGPHGLRQAWNIVAADIGHWQLRGFGWFVIDDGTGAVGTCGVHHPPNQSEPEIGWTTFAEAQGKGYATEAARAVLGWASGVIDAPRIVSYIDSDNAASKAVAAKLGATFTGAMADHNNMAEIWAHAGAAA